MTKFGKLSIHLMAPPHKENVFMIEMIKIVVDDGNVVSYDESPHNILNAAQVLEFQR